MLTFFLAHVVHQSADPSRLSSIDEDSRHGLVHHHGGCFVTLYSFEQACQLPVRTTYRYESECTVERSQVTYSMVRCTVVLYRTVCLQEVRYF